MAGRKHTKIQVEERRTHVASWYLQGVTQLEIGHRLGLAQSQIAYDVKVIRKRWNMDTAINLDAHKMKELAKLDELERVYWDAWRRSLEIAKRSLTERTTGGTGESLAKARILTIERDGNPAFLAGVEKCIEARRKMLGLDAPEQHEIGGPAGGPIPIMSVQVSAQVLAEAGRILREVEGHELSAG